MHSIRERDTQKEEEEEEEAFIGCVGAYCFQQK